MSDLTLNSADLKRTISNLNKVEARFQQLFLEAVQAKTPVVTGKLRDGFQLENGTLVNYVHYAGYVEFGTSYTRPVGMVSTTILEAPQLFQQAVEESDL